MKIAAVNFNAVFANVDENMKQVAHYIKEAAHSGVELILFPEFFTSSMGRSPKMLDVPIQSNHVHDSLLQLASQYNMIIGGSYLQFDGKDAHNLFELIFPDGQVFSHKKDIPTIAENCYYTCGDEDPILHTPIGDIGVALCWEMIRFDTLKRLSEKVDLILASSCWEDLREGAPLKEYNRQFALQTPVTFAKLLHVPVIHANHCGYVTAVDFFDEENPFTFQMVGATQMIDGDGNLIARRSFDEGEGMVVSDFSLIKRTRKPADIHPSNYWIVDMPDSYTYAWENFTPNCKAYYENTAKPYYMDRLGH